MIFRLRRKSPDQKRREKAVTEAETRLRQEQLRRRVDKLMATRPHTAGTEPAK
ncbi:MAG TPA: hypothetical protein PKE65_06820 [Rhizobiaceae bacterium]|nr:hypothetical protein [Rhizobiaceae bacterium]